MMLIAMTAVDEAIGRPTGPAIAGGEDSFQGSAFAILNSNVEEPLTPLATFTRSLEKVIALRRIHIFGSASYPRPVFCTRQGTRRTEPPHRPHGSRGTRR